VEETRTRTLVLGDARGNDRFLRVTWHPTSSTIVFSHWTGSVCVASTPVRLPEASKVIDLLVGALRDLADKTGTADVGDHDEQRALDWLLQRLRPTVGMIRQLPEQLPTRWSRHGRG
jgi:hypothetical protein